MQLKRGKKRLVGGVCAALGEKYKIEPWLLRIGLIILSVYFYYTVLAYIVAWISIPNEVKADSKEQNQIQTIGLIIGGVLGALSFGAVTYFAALILNDPGRGGIAVGILAVMGIPVGMAAGFSIARMKVENKALKEQNNQ